MVRSTDVFGEGSEQVEDVIVVGFEEVAEPDSVFSDDFYDRG
jgi:hypothetical protein